MTTERLSTPQSAEQTPTRPETRNAPHTRSGGSPETHHAPATDDARPATPTAQDTQLTRQSVTPRSHP